MQPTISAKELADILEMEKSTVSRQADKEKWSFVWDKVRGGHRKLYLPDLLPHSIRLLLAAKSARVKVSRPGHGAKAGTDLAATIVKRDAVAAEQARIAKESGLAAYSALPADKKAIADARREILCARNAFIRSAGVTVKAGTQAFCDHYLTGAIQLPESVVDIIGKTLSWSTLNRWQKAYDTLGMIGLAPGYHNPKKGTTTVPQPMCDLIIGLVVAYPHIEMTRVMDALAARFHDQDLPSESVARRFSNQYKNNNAGLLLAIKNPDKWRSYRQLAYGSVSENVERLNQMWEYDSTIGDVMLHEGRHCVIGVIDLFTRRLKLLVSKTSRSTAVAAITRAAVLDWGVPECIRTDNGADYTSAHMVRVIEGLGVGWDLCTPFQPQQKPHIERAFQTFTGGLFELLPGYVGHSVADRKDIEARRSFSQRLMGKGGQVDIDLTAAEFQALCDDWLDAIYHQDKHAGLGDRSPAEVARAWRKPVRMISDERALDCLLAEVAGGGGLRTVTKKGIQVNGITYQAPEFGAIIDENRQVRVKEDAADLGQVHCYDPESGVFLCVAVDPMRKGIDRAEMAGKSHAIQKQVMKDGIKKLKKIARDTAADGIHQEILAHRKGLIANTVELPRLTMEYTTPALEEAGLAAVALAGKRREPLQMSVAEIAQSEAILADLERKSGIRMAMPATETEAYDMLLDERDSQGLELSDREERWVLEYEIYLETGRRKGLMAEGWQPYAERARIAREATGK